MGNDDDEYGYGHGYESVCEEVYGIVGVSYIWMCVMDVIVIEVQCCSIHSLFGL